MTPKAPLRPRQTSTSSTDALIARPLAAPQELDSALRRRWELFAPALAACLREALQRSSDTLFAEAGDAQAPDRRRLAFASATELASRAQTLETNCRAALVRLFLDPEGLATGWHSEVGAFTLRLACERLERSQADALLGLHRRLHRAEAPQMEQASNQLAGLLAATFDTASLSVHARNVLCTTFARRLETVLPGLAGASNQERPMMASQAPVVLSAPPSPDASESGQRSPAPRPVLDALTRLQLLALEHGARGDLAAQVGAYLASSRSPFETGAAERCIGRIRDETRRLDALSADPRVPPVLARHLRTLAPVTARIHVEHAPPHTQVHQLIGMLLEHCIDLDADSRDTRLQALDDAVGAILARFRGDPADLGEFVVDAWEQLAAMTRRQGEIRRRARERAVADRRREHARRAADAICLRLSFRDELVPFIERAWRGALTQVHLRYGPDSLPWRRMLVLGQALLTASRSDLPELRPSLADALSLALSDAVEVELTLDSLALVLQTPSDETLLPAGPSTSAAVAGRPVHREDLAWRLEDGRRRWLMVQARDGGDEVLLADALARHLEWMPAAEFDAGVATGSILLLEPEDLLRDYASR